MQAYRSLLPRRLPTAATRDAQEGIARAQRSRGSTQGGVRTSANQANRYNYIQDEFSEGESLNQLISQFSQDSRILQLQTADQLAKFNHPPSPSICLARDFIHDSLYNPNYGYFFNQVEIFDRASHTLQALLNPAHPSDWTKSFEDDLYAEYFDPSSAQHQNQLLVRRQRHDDQQQEPPSSSSSSDQRQIWHTPTELFKPWYAWSMASYIVENHLKESSQKSKLKELKIYEIGAGNGTLCCGILDYIKEHHAGLYEVTQYTTIELSTRLAQRQRDKISHSGHEAHARVVNRSILGLTDSPELSPCPEPCWVLGMEVLDNLSRDVIRRERVSGEPLQSIVITDYQGDYHERFIPITLENNPALLSYLDIMHPHRTQPRGALTTMLENLLATYMPFRSNLTPHEFIPSNYLHLLRSIFRFFPRHRLILSDFSHLPNTLNHPRSNRLGAPVVQTRYNGVTVPASTFLVKPGMFDIFFPTDFGEFARLYNHLHQESLHDDDDDGAPTPSGVRPDSPCVGLQDQNQFLLRILASPHMQQLVRNKTKGAPLDLQRIFGYYQNVKVFTVT
ncbi:hypothetical protein PCANC_08276 [Puccinia coronata f. sp. avenae]|uniref:Protein arginine methyltransferase NDUFAF7 n=1 Tax=Puccinia coronata f. sp. avenae TaxID=200324 RepID=A0A2N5T0R6_9BASI|nr:hypothetical protein PCANC_08276 [Puccinia coronata f. sp. avenae]